MVGQGARGVERQGVGWPGGQGARGIERQGVVHLEAAAWIIDRLHVH